MGVLTQIIADGFGERGYTVGGTFSRRVRLPPGDYAALAIGSQSEHDMVYVEHSGIPGALQELPDEPTERDFHRLPRCSIGSPLILSPGRKTPVLVAARFDLAYATSGDASRMLGRVHVVGYGCVTDLACHPMKRPPLERFGYLTGYGSMWLPAAGRNRLVFSGVYDSATPSVFQVGFWGYRRLYTGDDAVSPGANQRLASISSDAAAFQTELIGSHVMQNDAGPSIPSMRSHEVFLGRRYEAILLDIDPTTGSPDVWYTAELHD